MKFPLHTLLAKLRPVVEAKSQKAEEDSQSLLSLKPVEATVASNSEPTDYALDGSASQQKVIGIIPRLIAKTRKSIKSLSVAKPIEQPTEQAAIQLPKNDESSDDPCDSKSTESTDRSLTNVFGIGAISPFQPVPVTNEFDKLSNILEFPSVSAPATDNEQPKPVAETEAKVTQLPIQLEISEAQKQKGYASYYLLQHQLTRYNRIEEPDSEEMRAMLHMIIVLHLNAYHMNTQCVSPSETVPILATDFNEMVSLIRKIRNRVGLGELAIMVLLANVTDDMQHWKRPRSEAWFYKSYAQQMGLSPSRARDYVKRGRIFLEYKDDILKGVEGVPGITIQELASSYMAKLTLYGRAVNRLGRKQALLNMKTLTFAEFQKAIAFKDVIDKPKPKKESPIVHEDTDDPASVHESYKSELQELDLQPNEKRLLRIIVKGGIPVHVPKALTDTELELIETRLREERVKRLESEYIQTSGYKKRGAIDPKRPTVINKELLNIKDYSEIVLRIRAAVSLLQPMRRIIALLLFRLHSEKVGSTNMWPWKNPREGVKYSSFRDFAIQELGMSEDYRDYLAVGRVIRYYSRFLDYLADIDTEETFLKLRFLPAALLSHQENEPLVLARLRTLTIREFRLFAIYPDFETTFTKRLTKKHMEKFMDVYDNNIHSPYRKNGTDVDFIEAYDKDEESFVWLTARKVLREISPAAILPSSTEEEHNTSDQDDGITCADVHEPLDNNSDQRDTVMVS